MPTELSGYVARNGLLPHYFVYYPDTTIIGLRYVTNCYISEYRYIHFIYIETYTKVTFKIFNINKIYWTNSLIVY